MNTNSTSVVAGQPSFQLHDSASAIAATATNFHVQQQQQAGRASTGFPISSSTSISTMMSNHFNNMYNMVHINHQRGLQHHGISNNCSYAPAIVVMDPRLQGTNDISIRDLSLSSRSLAAIHFVNNIGSFGRSGSAASSTNLFYHQGSQNSEQRHRAAMFATSNPLAIAERERVVEAVTERIMLSQHQEQQKAFNVSGLFKAEGSPVIIGQPTVEPLLPATSQYHNQDSSGPALLFSPEPPPGRTALNDDLSHEILTGTNEEALDTLGKTCLQRREKKIPYFDASTLEDPNPIIVANKRARGGVSEPFPEKLYRMLTDAAIQGHEDILSFHPHGRSFGIHNPERFAKIVMPQYFRQSRLSSFHRQLNLYGFARINTGPDAGGYYHELFLRGRPFLGAHVQRVGVPQAGVPRRRGVKAHNASVDPDFYSFPDIRLLTL